MDGLRAYARRQQLRDKLAGATIQRRHVNVLLWKPSTRRHVTDLPTKSQTILSSALDDRRENVLIMKCSPSTRATALLYHFAKPLRANSVTLEESQVTCFQYAHDVVNFWTGNVVEEASTSVDQ